MRKILYCVMILFSQLPLVVVGQNALFVHEEGDKQHSVPLNGKAEVVFVSKSRNLFIESSRPSLDTRLDPKRNSKGEWEYVIQLQLTTREGVTNERSFTITESGTTDMVIVPKKLYIGNNRYVYSVKRNKNTIFLVDNTQPNDVHLVNGEAAVEILSTSKVTVTPHPNLPCNIANNTTEAGVYSTVVTINMSEFVRIMSDANRDRQKYEQYNETLISRAENGEFVSDHEWDSLSRWQEQTEKEDQELVEISTINISLKESNTLTIDVSKISPKRKWTFVVKGSENIKGSKEYDQQRWFTLADYVFSPKPQHSFGLTFGRVRQYGWYTSFTTNGNFTISADHKIEETTTAQNYYLWSGEMSTTRFSVVVGGIVALWDFGYFYTGLGYGMRNRIWFTKNEESVSIRPEQFNGLLIDAGSMINASEHLLLSAGFSIQIPETYYEFKIGVGIRF